MQAARALVLSSRKGEIVRKVSEDKLVAALMEEIDRI